MVSHGRPTPMISKQHYQIIMEHADRLNSAIVYDRDFQYQYFGFKTLERSYLLKINGKTVERPQHMLMRVAVGIHGEDIDAAIETYSLKKKVAKHGVRNSLLLAPMPTASTAQILGNNESVEAYTSNIYTRRVLSGEFQVVNQHLLRDLTELGIWTDDLKNDIVSANGSIQHISSIPDNIKKLYKTVWEISQKNVIQQAADRGAFIDQSQSLNIHIAEPNFGKMSSMHFYGWESGLKTGMYYLRTKPAAQAIQFTVDKAKVKETLSAKKDKSVLDQAPAAASDLSAVTKNMETLVCSIQNRDDCFSCGS